MRAVARAHQKRNLADFEKALQDYKQGAHRVPVTLEPVLTLATQSCHLTKPFVLTWPRYMTPSWSKIS